MTPNQKYSAANKQRHVMWEQLVRKKQIILMTALEAKLITLQAAGGAGKDVALEIANLENEISDLEFESLQDVPHKLTAEEAASHYNNAKTHSLREATLEKHHGQVYALIYGHCTQLLKDKMKQEKSWEAVSASYKHLELYKLIESVILKQTEDQYPVAAVWDQYMAVYNAKQGSLSNTEWYKRFHTKVEVAESVGCAFANNRTLDYCAELENKKSYDAPNAIEKAAVDVLARDRFMAYGLLNTSSTANDKVQSDLLDDFTNGSNIYLITPQQTLLLLDKYSKKPAVVTHSEGTEFAQKDKKKGNANKKDETPKKSEYDREDYKDLACFRCGKLGHPEAACTVKMVPANEETKSTKSLSTNGSLSSSKSDMGKIFLSINNNFKTMVKAMSQVSEEIAAYSDEDSIVAQSHALVRVINGRSSYAFANNSAKMREFLLLDNHVRYIVLLQTVLVL